jgi:hypothetical protein
MASGSDTNWTSFYDNVYNPQSRHLGALPLSIAESNGGAEWPKRERVGNPSACAGLSPFFWPQGI